MCLQVIDGEKSRPSDNECQGQIPVLPGTQLGLLHCPEPSAALMLQVPWWGGGLCTCTEACGGVLNLSQLVLRHSLGPALACADSQRLSIGMRAPLGASGPMHWRKQ